MVKLIATDCSKILLGSNMHLLGSVEIAEFE